MDYDKSIDINTVNEIRGRGTVYYGCGAINKAGHICEQLVKKGVKKMLVVTGKSSYLSCGAWEPCLAAFKEHNIEICHYNGFKPNPEDGQVDEAVKMAKEKGCVDAVWAIGGGSVEDGGKAAAILLAPEHADDNCEAVFTYKVTPAAAVPIVCVNTSHGTGTEADMFSVVSVLKYNYKPYIASEHIYPLFAIDDPSLCTSLNKVQTLYTSVDALNHVNEACSTKVTSPYVQMMAKEVGRIVFRYTKRAIDNPEDKEARYWLLYASCLAGIAFDHGALHYTHALEHPLSAIKPELSHGLGLGMILPAVIKTIYTSAAPNLAELYAPICPNLDASEASADKLACAVEKWLFSVGMTQKLADFGYTEDQVPQLCELVKTTPGLGGLIGLAPNPDAESKIEEIYKSSFRPMYAH